jgi:chromosome segregation ATPase
MTDKYAGLCLLNPTGQARRILEGQDAIETLLNTIRSEVMSEITDLAGSVRAAHDELRALDAKVGRIAEIVAGIRAANAQLLIDLDAAKQQNASDADKLAAQERIIADHVAEEQSAMADLALMTSEEHAAAAEIDAITDPPVSPA